MSETTSAIEVKGSVEWVLTRADGTVERGENHNLVVTAGKSWLAQYLTAGAPPANMGYMGFGTSSTTPAAADTALGAELSSGTYTGYARPSTTKSNSGQTATYVATLTNISGGLPVTIQECGLFNATSTGTMFAHALTGAITLSSSSDSLQLTWNITFN